MEHPPTLASSPLWTFATRRPSWTHQGTVTLILTLALHLHATAGTSTHYAISPDTLDAGGSRSNSTIYSNIGSIGAVSGVATATTPQISVFSGYAAQLPSDGGLSGSEVPTVASPSSTGVTTTGATLGGSVTSDGGATVASRGVVFALSATNANPESADQA